MRTKGTSEEGGWYLKSSRKLPSAPPLQAKAARAGDATGDIQHFEKLGPVLGFGEVLHEAAYAFMALNVNRQGLLSIKA